MTQKNLSDGELVQRSRRGSRKSFYHLVTRYSQLVAAVVNNKIFGCPERDDLVQETFLIAWKSLDKLKDPEKFASWLYGITLNICRAWIRKKGKQGVSLEELEKHGWSAPDPKTDQDANRVTDQQEMVQTALAGIKEEYREAIYLYHFEKRSYQEIADFLNVSTALVNKRLTLARKELRIKIKKTADSAD